jgi:toxin ParE1/3/4
MTRIQLAAQALGDLDRIRDILLSHDPDHEAERIQELLIALDVLTHAPEIGRPVAAGTRELIIGRGARGYVARYRDLSPMDIAIVLAVRHQRERGVAP